MQEYNHRAGATVHHNVFDVLNWPVIGLNVAVIAWFQDLMNHFPGPTAIYTVVTTIFMLFQMADKLGWLDRFKRPTKQP